MPYLVSLAVLTTILYAFYRYATADSRRRATALAEDFPTVWRQVLTERVAFYLSLTEHEKARFEKQVQVFLADTRITGVHTQVDDTIRLLVAASALIPVFGFPDWEYRNLGEVLIVPDAWTLPKDPTKEVKPLEGTLLGAGLPESALHAPVQNLARTRLPRWDGPPERGHSRIRTYAGRGRWRD